MFDRETYDLDLGAGTPDAALFSLKSLGTIKTSNQY